MQIETIKIKVKPTPDIPDGFIVINKSDFVPGEHEPLLDFAPTSVVKEEAAPVPPAPAEPAPAAPAAGSKPWIK